MRNGKLVIVQNAARNAHTVEHIGACRLLTAGLHCARTSQTMHSGVLSPTYNHRAAHPLVEQAALFSAGT